jgi:hypothetical protein
MSLSVIYANTIAFIASQNIQYKDFITLNKVQQAEITKKLKRDCIPITLNDLSGGSYLSKHYISKGKVICKKDIKPYEKKTVIFNFGTFEIEKEGEIIYQDNKVVKIRKPNGKIEKIYKNGALR